MRNVSYPYLAFLRLDIQCCSAETAILERVLPVGGVAGRIVRLGEWSGGLDKFALTCNQF